MFIFGGQIWYYLKLLVKCKLKKIWELLKKHILYLYYLFFFFEVTWLEKQYTISFLRILFFYQKTSQFQFSFIQKWGLSRRVFNSKAYEWCEELKRNLILCEIIFYTFCTSFISWKTQIFNTFKVSKINNLNIILL